MKNMCRICAIADGAGRFGVTDTKMADDLGYFVIPSVGSLVEGWSLVVPHEHCVSLRGHYHNQGFQTFVAHAAHCIAEVYGAPVAFEHGPNTDGSATGCGTDHAHLHIVPFALTVEDVCSSGVWFSAVESANIAETVDQNEYLAFFPNIVGTPEVAYVALLKEPVSQFFRRLIGRKLGLSVDEMDYKKSSRLDVSTATALALQPVFECIGIHA